MIVDTDLRLTAAQYAGLKAAGALAVGRYLDRLNPAEAKVIGADEARAAAAAGMPIFLVYEIGGRPSGTSQGQLDAAWCRAYLPAIGMPADCAIYNAVDYDAQPADMPGIADHFGAFRSPGSYRTGAYGSGYVTGQLFGSGLIDQLRWVSESGGFLGTAAAIASGAYEMRQSVSGPVLGISVDVNTLREPGLDFGARVPFAGENQAAPPAAVAAAAPPPESFLDRLRQIFGEAA